jgi:hypothetical protein
MTNPAPYPPELSEIRARVEFEYWRFGMTKAQPGPETLRHSNRFPIKFACWGWGDETTRGLSSKGYRVEG